MRTYEGILPAPKAYTPFSERQNARTTRRMRNTVRLLGIAKELWSGQAAMENISSSLDRGLWSVYVTSQSGAAPQDLLRHLC